MRINLPPPKDYGEWHNWFAWYPVVIGNKVVWLETVRRQLSMSMVGGYWRYSL